MRQSPSPVLTRYGSAASGPNGIAIGSSIGGFGFTGAGVGEAGGVGVGSDGVAVAEVRGGVCAWPPVAARPATPRMAATTSADAPPMTSRLRLCRAIVLPPSPSADMTANGQLPYRTQ
ncbi:hypothetical protein [Candidatus Amarobacter glycogenicus]|uniref:hypothetical protein n=1 Tax=Candidatus Amarobacter glycogenicus TaxID=3140699 RepID=UPI002A180B64|nr:hypothetical protein [Dehalococcoidia bacterium]